MSAEDITEKIEEYAKFVSKKLRPELSLAESSRDETRKEMKEYQELSDKLKAFQKEGTSELKTMVDLGHGAIHCNAIGNLDKIYLHVGMGFHVEMTIPEAIGFIDKRLDFLQKSVLKGKEAKVKEITDHIMEAATILDELNRELQRSG